MFQMVPIAASTKFSKIQRSSLLSSRPLQRKAATTQTWILRWHTAGAQGHIAFETVYQPTEDQVILKI